jgi:hypothetical protein
MLNPGYLFLPITKGQETSPIPTGDIVGVHSENIFDTLIWAAGSGNDVALYTEASSDDPAPTAVTGGRGPG